MKTIQRATPMASSSAAGCAAFLAFAAVALAAEKAGAVQCLHEGDYCFLVCHRGQCNADLLCEEIEARPDGNDCTDDLCNPSECQGGLCVPTGPLTNGVDCTEMTDATRRALHPPARRVVVPHGAARQRSAPPGIG